MCLAPDPPKQQPAAVVTPAAAPPPPAQSAKAPETATRSAEQDRRKAKSRGTAIFRNPLATNTSSPGLQIARG